MKTKPMFSEFPPVSTEEWIKKIEKDLKGKPYEKLIKKTNEGFEIKPFYREEDLKGINFLNNLPGSFPYLRGKNIKKNNWLTRQDIIVDDVTEANVKALKLIDKGVDSLGFVFKENINIDKNNLEKLLKNIPADSVELNFKSSNPLEIVKYINDNYDPQKIKGSLDYDPLASLTLKGSWNKEKEFDLILKLYNEAGNLPFFQLITVNASIFHNSGGTVISELAYALSMATEYLTFLTENGISVDEAAPKIRFHFATGSEYFTEIAKFRAFRYLWSKTLDAYGLENKENAITRIHASSSLWNKTVYDPYVNMLRTTTESMSAIISGVGSITVMPFDSTYTHPDVFSERIAKNQPLILKEESYFDKVVDPAAGSYYIENLTKELIIHSWDLFLDNDKNGVYSEIFIKGLIQKRIKSEAKEKDLEIALGKRTVLGVNKFPNLKETLDKLDDETVLFPQTAKEAGIIAEPLTIYRGAMTFERLRYKTDRYAEKHRRPKVWMFTFGNIAMRRARSQFAGNFFGVAGFEIIDNIGFDTIEQGISETKKANPDIVVLCASDEDYKTSALQIFHALKEDFIVVLAGYPKDLVDELQSKGFNNFIHVKSNLLEDIKKYQKLLQIK